MSVQVAEGKPKVTEGVIAELPRLPGTDVVGHGYDATREYASAECVTLPIFDLGDFDAIVVAPNGTTYSLPAVMKRYLTLADMSRGEYRCISGETAQEYRKQLNVLASVSASYMLFSGSVKTQFDQQELASINHSFVTLYHHYSGWKLGLPDLAKLRMVPSARDDIEGTSGLSAPQVIEKYGTHVVVSAVVGGRARYTCLVDRSKYSSQVSVATAVEASYKAALKLDARMETQYKEAVEQLRNSSRTEFDTIGGTFSPTFDPTSFVEWMNAFKTHPVLVDFSKGSLVEIYKLASSKPRQLQLEAAFTEYTHASNDLVPDNTPLLEVMIFPSGELVGTDAGSGASMDLAVYRPKIGQGWCWLGQSANADNQFVIVRPLVPGVVAPPLGYDKVWDDHGSGNLHGYSLFNIQAPPHYRALGGMARLRTDGSRDYAPPSGAAVEGLVCVHESLCTEGKIGAGMLWRDKGSWASWDGSVWPIEAKDADGLETHTFYCARGYGRPNVTVYVLKRSNKIQLTS